MAPVNESLPYQNAWNIAGIRLLGNVSWQPAISSVQQAMQHHVSCPEVDPHIVVNVVSEREYNLRSKESSRSTFETLYGEFVRAHWNLESTPVVTLGVNRSPLRLLRPLVNAEGHPIHRDVGRMIHERVLTSFVQLGMHPLTASFLHGAAMVDAHGAGMVISGAGGVGKTSLALELGRHHAWKFVSDDMVLVDETGTMHLNGNAPKLYAYNVVGDPELEALVLDGRSPVNRLQWGVLKRWPNRVRRSVDPLRLYSELVHTAQLKRVLLVERGPFESIQARSMSIAEAAASGSLTLVDEMKKASPDIEAFLGAGVGDHRLSWGKAAWEDTLNSVLAEVEILHVGVPKEMHAVPYRKQMIRTISDLSRV